MSITENRLKEIQETIASWKNMGPEAAWEDFTFDDFNGLAGETQVLLAEVHRLRDIEYVAKKAREAVARLRNELAKAREVTDEKVNRVHRAVETYVSGRLADLDAEDMAWDATRAALGGGDDA